MTVSPETSYRLRYGAPTVVEPPAEWTEVLAQQLSHRSVRRYRPDDEVSDETLSALIAAAQSAPTSGNLQLWSVVAVRDDARGGGSPYWLVSRASSRRRRFSLCGWRIWPGRGR
ncbi:hypothetical protein GCM10029976_006480 [Kribbella albertanoniae]